MRPTLENYHDPFARAQNDWMWALMDKHGSIRELSRKTGFHHATLSTWARGSTDISIRKAAEIENKLSEGRKGICFLNYLSRYWV